MGKAAIISLFSFEDYRYRQSTYSYRDERFGAGIRKTQMISLSPITYCVCSLLFKCVHSTSGHKTSLCPFLIIPSGQLGARIRAHCTHTWLPSLSPNKVSRLFFLLFFFVRFLCTKELKCRIHRTQDHTRLLWRQQRPSMTFNIWMSSITPTTLPFHLVHRTIEIKFDLPFA